MMAKILVVDDDPDVVMSTRLCLEAEGHEVIEAKNGTECLARIRTQRPDLIILDVMMDTTTEGFQISLMLRSEDPTSEYYAFRDIPILILTSIHSTTSMRFGPTEDYLPVEEFVDKPIDPDDLVQKVSTLLKM
jgi:CheY-like chemotaxis protein